MASNMIGLIMLVVGILLAFIVDGPLPSVLSVAGFATFFIGLDIGKIKDQLDKESKTAPPAQPPSVAPDK